MVMMAIGVAAIVVGFMTIHNACMGHFAAQQFLFHWQSHLAGTFFIAFNYAAQSGWSVAV